MTESEVKTEPPREKEQAALRVRLFDEREDGRRDATLAAWPGAGFFHQAGWRRAVRRVFRHKPMDLVATRGEELVGVLPLVRCRGLSGRKHLISVPYGVAGGPVGTDREVVAALVDEAKELARREGVGRLELRTPGGVEDPELRPSDLYVTFQQELPEDPADVLKGMKKDERRLVRRAADKHGLELCEGGWFVEDLGRLFQASKHKLGTPALPTEWFQALLDELPDSVVVHMVRRGMEPVAVSMSFVFGSVFQMYYIGTTEEANRSFAATSFMIAELKRWCIARGLRTFDLGRSRKDAGTFQFKQNQGFEARPLDYRYYLVRDKGLPSFTPSNPRTEFLRKTWARLPAWFVERLSGRLSRYLP